MEEGMGFCVETSTVILFCLLFVKSWGQEVEKYDPEKYGNGPGSRDEKLDD